MIVFSVIVVSLNTKKDFIKTTNSIFSQRSKKYETIIIDGKSIDGTVDLIKKFKYKKNVKSLIEKDTGIYDAMNKGIKIAKGKWIIFMNSGDIFYNKHVLKVIEKKLDDKIDVFFGNTIIKKYNLLYRHSSKLINKTTYKMPFSHQCTITKSHVMKKNLFNTKYKISSDFDFFLKIYKNKKKFKKINKPIVISQGGGLSDSNRLKVFYENLNILKKRKLLNKKKIILSIFFFQIIFTKIIKFILPNIIIQSVIKMKHTKISRNSYVKQ